MKTTRRFALGIFLGAICGAALASLCLKLPLVQQTLGTHSCDFQIAFGRFFAAHIFSILTSAGAIIGAAMGGSLAVSKRWCIILSVLFIGTVIGGAVVFYAEERVIKWSSGMWEQIYSTERASIYLQGLKAIDRGTTNQLYLVRFQEEGRMVLTNYVREMENLSVKENGDFSGTNSPSYKLIRKYLATH